MMHYNIFPSRKIAAALLVAGLAILFNASLAGAGYLDATVSSYFEQRESYLDLQTNQPDSDDDIYLYDENLTLAAEDIGPGDLSLYSDLSFANTFQDSRHKSFEMSTMYLDFQKLLPGFELKLGRFFSYDLLSNGIYSDGLALKYSLGRLLRFSAGAGLPIPSRYSTDYFQSDINTLRAQAGVDYQVLNNTWIGLIASNEKDQGDQINTRFGASIDSRIAKVVTFKADIRDNVSANLIEEYSAQLRYLPASWMSMRAIVVAQQDTIDSIDAYTKLILARHTDYGIGASLFGSEGKNLDVHYTFRQFDTSQVQIVGFTGSAYGAFAGIEFGIGNGRNSWKPMLGYGIGIADNVRISASARYFQFQLPEQFDDQWRNSLCSKIDLTWGIPQAGITLIPEIEYLSNSYYTHDVRLVINASYNYKKFWK